MRRRKCVILGVILPMACTETIPPIGPEQASKPDGSGPERVEIDDPGPGGGGSGGTIGWDYTWVHATLVNINYGADCPGIDCNGHANAATDWVWDQADRKFTWQNGSRDVFIPHLIDQDSKADQVALAKAIVYMCDGTPIKKFYTADSVSYYDEVWHAIRNMMKDHRSYAYSDTTLCKTGWIGMARNLMGYVIAADYLMSLGPVGNRGYRSQVGQTYESACGGLPCCDNSKTRPSLPTWVRQLTSESLV